MNSAIYNSGAFIGKNGVEIFFQNWLAKDSAACVVLVHGYGEHSGRYTNLLKKFDQSNISVYSIDLRGHGKSDGQRGHVERFSDYVNDLKIFYNLIMSDNIKAPIFLLGHSMGGVVSIKYALDYPDDFNGVILSSAALTLNLKVPKWKETIGAFFSKYMPGLSSSSGLPVEYISRDDEVVKNYLKDPLNHNRASSRWFMEFFKAREECIERSCELRIPMMIFHGTDDKIVSTEGSEILYRNAPSSDKELYLFEGMYHELINEIPEDREKVLDTISKWVLTRSKKNKSNLKSSAENTAKKVKKKASSNIKSVPSGKNKTVKPKNTLGRMKKK